MLVKRVTTEEELNDVFKVRYMVYCLERGYEKPEDYPNGFESDEYDPYSIHFIVYVDSLPIGTARLILRNPFDFPIERYCHVDMKSICTDTSKVAEISRLAVSSEVTKGCSIKKTLIMFNLIREIYLTTKVLNIEYVFAAMGKGLERMLKKCGIMFLNIGDPVEYHGIRIPYYAHIDELMSGLSQNQMDIFQFLSSPPNASLSIGIDNFVNT
jgi:N-acyl-L-homoserine lactone synthetase